MQARLSWVNQEGAEATLVEESVNGGPFSPLGEVPTPLTSLDVTSPAGKTYRARHRIPHDQFSDYTPILVGVPPPGNFAIEFLG